MSRSLLAVVLLVSASVASLVGCGQQGGSTKLEPVTARRASDAFPASTDAPASPSASESATPAPTESTATPAPVTGETATPTTAPVTASAAAAAPAAPASGPVTLRFRFQPGSELRFASTTQTTQQMRGRQGTEAPRPVTSSLEADIKVRVLAVEGERTKVEIGIEKAAMNADEKQAAAAVKQASEAMEGVTMAATFDSLGRPIESNVTKGSIQEATAAGIASDIGFMGVRFPEGPVDEGAKWTTTLDFAKVMSRVMPLPNATFTNQNLPVNFRLARLDRWAGTATIEIQIAGKPAMKVKMPDPPPGETRATNVPREMNAAFNVDQKGTAVVEIGTGMIRELTMGGNVGMSGFMGMTMDQRITSTLRRK